MSDGGPGEQRTDQPHVAADLADDPSQFPTVGAHFYRAEVERMATWRTRLDQTTNWAVVVLAAILTWAFSSPDNPHYVLLIGLVAVGAFLIIEAQRYQEYDAWRSRVRLLQVNFFSNAFQRGELEQEDWRERLSQDLQEPTLQLPLWKAVAHRLQRVYFLLLTVLLAAWAARITVFATSEPWSQTASVAFVPGPVVVAVVVGAYLVAVGLTVWSFSRAAKREFEKETRTHTPRKSR